MHNCLDTSNFQKTSKVLENVYIAHTMIFTELSDHLCQIQTLNLNELILAQDFSSKREKKQQSE